MSNETLEKFCDSIVDSLYIDLPRGQFFIRALQAKNGNVFLRIKKKRVRLVDVNKLNDFVTMIYNCVNTSYNFYCNLDLMFQEKYFVDFRPIKTNSGHPFHFI